MIIDIHAHVGPWHDFLLAEPSAEWLVATNDRIGIGTAGISHLVAFGYDTRLGNELALAAAEAHPGKLGVWLTANPHLDDVALIREQLEHPSVWGLKLHPDVQEYPVTGRRYRPYLEAAAEVSATVLSHGQTRSPWSAPQQIAQVAREYPDSAFLLGHAGLFSDGIDDVAELAAGIDNLYAECCGSRITHVFLERLVEVAGSEKVVFGSDACFLDQRWAVGRALHAELGDDARRLLLHDNAIRILAPRLRKDAP